MLKNYLKIAVRFNYKIKIPTQKKIVDMRPVYNSNNLIFKVN